MAGQVELCRDIEHAIRDWCPTRSGGAWQTSGPDLNKQMYRRRVPSTRFQKLFVPTLPDKFLSRGSRGGVQGGGGKF